MVPLRLDPGLLLVPDVELLDLGVGQQVRPPAAGEDVVRRGSQRLAGCGVRSPRPVGEHQVMQPHLGVRAVHRNEVLEVRVGEEQVGLRLGHPLEQRMVVGGVELELLGDRDLVAGMALDELVHSLRVVVAVLGVLGDQRDGEWRLQLALLHQVVEELHLRQGEVLHRRQRAEHPLAPSEDRRRSRASREVRDAIAIRNHRLRLDQVRAVAAEDGVDLVLGDELLHQLRALRRVGGVVEQRQVDLHLLAADLDAARVVGLLDRELGGLLVGAADLRLLAGDREHGADLDLLCARRQSEEDHEEHRNRSEPRHVGSSGARV